MTQAVLDKILSSAQKAEDIPPYIFNQMRWALHCYRWKHNLSWNKYNDILCLTLGMPLIEKDPKNQAGENKKGKVKKSKKKLELQPNFLTEETTVIKISAPEKSHPFNEKDPKSWLLDNHQPKNLQKIRSYIEFLQKEAPEYAKAITEDEFLNHAADFMQRIYSPEQLDEEETEILSQQASYLEKYILVNQDVKIITSTGKVTIEDVPPHRPRLIVDRVISRDTASSRYPFGTEAVITAFRQIGATPFLKMYLFGTDLLSEFGYRQKTHKETEDVLNEIVRHCGGDDGEKIQTQYMFTGILCPTICGKKYIGLISRENGAVASVHLSFISSNTDDEVNGIDLKSGRQKIYHHLTIDGSIGPHTAENSGEPQLSVGIESLAYKIDYLQNLIAKYKP